MILRSAEPGIDEKAFGELYPRYAGQSLPNILGTVMDAFGAGSKRTPINVDLYKNHISLDGIEKVVLVVFDGLGYNMWLDSRNDQGFLGRIAQKGMLIPITTVFPSTTAAAITTINTGLTPLEHGLPEWVLYMHEIKMIINTLPFTPFMSERRMSLSDMGVDPKILYDGKTVYEDLLAAGVNSHTLVSRMLSNSAYNTLIKKGSKSHPYVYATDGVMKIRRILEDARGPTYVNFYTDSIDSMTHVYGPYTEESRGEINSVSAIFKAQLLDKISRKAAKNTLMLVTADHGHTTINPNKVIYLNGDRKLKKFMASNGAGKILPTGSPRGAFLHINKADIEEACSYLTRKFAGKARIMKSRDAISMGLFGTGKMHPKFRDRVGDIMILPREGEAIWYEHVQGKKQKLIGMHGGLSANEMLIPLGMARLSDIM